MTFGLTIHEDRSRLKALADYSTAMGGWPRGVSVNASRGWATEKKEWGGPRTSNMEFISVTELVTQLPMSRLKALARYSIATGGWPRGVSVNASRGRATEKKEWGGPRTENMRVISVTPDVHDVAISASLTVPTSASRPARSRFVYVTPFTTPVSPTLALGHRTVTPLGAR